MSITSTSPTVEPRLPRQPLVVLGIATFAMVTAEMLPTAVLQPMSRGLSTTDARAAQLVSLWAAVVVITSLPLVRLTRRFDRRSLIVTGMLALAVSAGLTAAAPNYPAAVAARLVGAVAVGLLWATVNSHVAALVTDRQLGTAVSIVLGGATGGVVLGTPLGRLLADAAGWRTAFAALAVLAAVIGLLVRTLVPAGQGGQSAPESSASSASSASSERSGRSVPQPSRAAGALPLLLITGLVAVALVGHYGTYTYITVLAAPAAAVVPGGLSGLLLVFGLAPAAGIALAGRVRERTGIALVVTTAAIAVSLVAIRIAQILPPAAGLAAVGLWGLTSGALPALAQTFILRQAGDRHRTMAGALIPVLFNGGIAIGAALAGAVAARAGASALPLPGAAIVLVAAAGLAVATIRPSPNPSPRPAAPGPRRAPRPPRPAPLPDEPSAHRTA